MTFFEIVAHRGVTHNAPENTIQAFEAAIALGVDAVELDVRLTADGIPIVYHYVYLDEKTNLSGPIFSYTLAQLQQAQIKAKIGGENESIPFKISTLSTVLDQICGRIGLEIEIKGPEPEAPELIAAILNAYRSKWDSMEITSYEAAIIRDMVHLCPGLAADLLYPRSEPWMNQDYVAYSAVHLARLAGARAVHLHPSQLSPEVVATIRKSEIEIHAWDVNDPAALETIADLGIIKICTDKPQQALTFRSKIVS